MKKIPSKALYLIAVFLGACSVEISDVTPVSTAVQPPALTMLAPNTVPVATRPPPISISTLAPQSTLASAEATPFNVPVTWADHNLTGKLIYTAGVDGVAQLDLVSGAVTRLFQPSEPSGSFVVAQAVSPDGATMVMAYAPPPVSGEVQYGYTGLYSLSLTSISPIQPLQAMRDREAFLNPIWSSDGQYIYYAHVSAATAQPGAIQYTIERLAYPDGHTDILVENAMWPRPSRDGSKLVYVGVDPTTLSNQIYVADADGQAPRQIVLPDTFITIDSPVFTLDNKAILFSAISASPSAALSWFDLLLGVQMASAHGAGPADWWRIPVEGGEPEKLTDILNMIQYGSFSPDGQHLAYIGGSGLYIMFPDGRMITQVLAAQAIPGTVGAATVEWIP